MSGYRTLQHIEAICNADEELTITIDRNQCIEIIRWASELLERKNLIVGEMYSWPSLGF